MTEQDTQQRDGKTPSVLLNGIRVLEAFSVEEPVLGVTEIARRLQLHKSTVSRTLTTLEEAGLVERETTTGRFTLGLGVIGLAGPILANLDVRKIAYPHLVALTKRTGETSALMVWNDSASVVVEQVPSPKQVKHTATIGTRYTTAASSSVRVLLSGLAEHEISETMSRGRYGAETETDGLIQRLRETTAAGYAINDGESSVEETGISAPVFDHRGHVTSAVLFSAPRFRTGPDMLEPLAYTVRATAREISHRLGAEPEQ